MTLSKLIESNIAHGKQTVRDGHGIRPDLTGFGLTGKFAF